MLLEDLSSANETSGDAGVRAANRIRTKAAAAARKTARITLLITVTVVVLAMIAVAGVGYYGWSTRVTGYAIDERPCSFDLQGMPLTGKRTYSYNYTEIFNFRYVDTTAVSEKTVLDVTGTAITIVGLYDAIPKAKPKPSAEETTSEDNSAVKAGKETATPVPHWWSISVDQGERGIQVLKPAKTYTFVAGKKAGVVEYKSFCR